MAAIDVSALFASSSPISTFISTLLASSVIAYPVPFHHPFRGHPSRPFVARLFLIPVSPQHFSCQSYLFLPHCATPFPDLCDPRLLAIRSTRSHHSRTSRAYLWAPSPPQLLAQLQLYMVSIARPFSAFMHRVSLSMCFSVCVSPFLPMMPFRLFRSNSFTA
jgi:hypothetical protein